jgi:hypothetical protein
MHLAPVLLPAAEAVGYIVVEFEDYLAQSQDGPGGAD